MSCSMKNYCLLFLILCCSGFANAQQQTTTFAQTDSAAAHIPETAAASIDLLGNYINQHFTTDSAKLRAIYFWIGNHIAYDVDNMYNYSYNSRPTVLGENALQNRKAVCQGYAELYKAVAGKCNIPAFVVGGYTRQEGEVVNVPHAWVAVELNNHWYLTDPTFGAGYVNNNTFHQHFNTSYFLVQPCESIKTHMPFDPMWELLEHPVSSADFYGQKFTGNQSITFAYADSIHYYERQPEIVQMQASAERIKQNGIKNPMTANKLQNLQQNIYVIQQNQKADQQNQAAGFYNTAVNHYNIAVNLFNDYINYFNHQFKPAKPDEDIQQMLDTCKTEVRTSLKLLGSVDASASNVGNNLTQLKDMIQKMQQQIDDQQKFLDKYFKTGKLFRPALFRKYKFMGIPLN